MSADKLTAVLDAGRENLSEGDFLKLSKFLMEMHSQTTARKIIVTKIVVLDHEVSYKTLKGKDMNIKVTKYKRTTYQSSADDVEIVGSINGEEFTMDHYKLFDKIYSMLNLTGCRQIKRRIGDHEDEFPILSKFYKHIYDIERDEHHPEDDDYEHDDDDDSPRNWSHRYKMTHLLGINDIDNRL